jgi:glycosyltransferase involved in cell wall biosynthesis
VIFTGFVPDADLPHWYSAARTLVMPSVDEGFGLPALESMACGTPVVVSRAGALPEVVGDAGLLFDPRSTAALQDALTLVLSDTPLHESLAARGLQRATQFTWRASARSAIETFSDVHGRRP